MATCAGAAIVPVLMLCCILEHCKVSVLATPGDGWQSALGRQGRDKRARHRRRMNMCCEGDGSGSKCLYSLVRSVLLHARKVIVRSKDDGLLLLLRYPAMQ